MQCYMAQFVNHEQLKTSLSQIISQFATWLNVGDVAKVYLQVARGYELLLYRQPESKQELTTHSRQ